ncbi:MAG: dynamin family protein [Oscillospiraceae bacterium]|nr:dynamin family protein [Oscillospiraceae bacterium]
MENAQEQYQSYHSMSSTISGGLDQLSEICSKVGLKDKADSLKESRERLMSHTFSVGILGEFKRGKSTVINALLGKEIMPADILPCSATMNRVSYALEPDVQLNLTDGSTEHIEINELVQYVTKLDADCSARAEKVEEAIVFYPCPFCQNPVCSIGKSSLHINPYGDIAPCMTVPVTLGNIREDRIGDIWENSIVLDQLRKLSMKDVCPSATDCKWVSHCTMCLGRCDVDSDVLLMPKDICAQAKAACYAMQSKTEKD